jgi:hypothetical protein
MTPIIEYRTVTHRRAVGTMHKPEWVGDTTGFKEEATESEMLATFGGYGFQLVAVIANQHDTERTFYFMRLKPT